MYAEFFSLRELPFNNTPDPRFFYSTPDHEEALASLIYAVKERKGFVLLTGEIGAGKTLVSRLMIKHFGGTIAFANVNHAIHSAADLMESVCAEFELPYEPGATNTQLVRTLHDFLLSKFSQNVPVVLVLDEGQNLPVEAFEQLRMIGNLEADDAKLLQIAIVGQPELQTTFRSPALRQLRQRIFRSFHLPALNRISTEGYIRHRLAVAGSSETDIFTAEAIEAVHGLSRGLPRLINTLCDNAMLSAYSADRRVIDRAFLESVAKQMTPQASDRPLSAMLAHDPRPVSPDNIASQDNSSEFRSRPSPPIRESTYSSAPVAEAQATRESHRVDALHRMLDDSTARARAEWERLSSASLNATDIVERTNEIQHELQRREEQIKRLIAMIRGVSSDLEPMLRDIRNATDASRREQSAARELDERLARKIESSKELLAELVVASKRALRAGTEIAVPPVVIHRPTTLVETTPRRAVKNCSSPESAFSRTMQEARTSLVELRELVSTVPTSSLAADRKTDEATRTKPAEVRPIQRLARGVDQLVNLIGDVGQ